MSDAGARATEADRAHFDAIGAAEAQSEIDRIDAALRTTPAERIRQGFELAAGGPWSPAHLAEIDAMADGQIELARRRIALGLGPEKPACTSTGS